MWSLYRSLTLTFFFFPVLVCDYIYQRNFLLHWKLSLWFRKAWFFFWADVLILSIGFPELPYLSFNLVIQLAQISQMESNIKVKWYSYEWFFCCMTFNSCVFQEIDQFSVGYRICEHRVVHNFLWLSFNGQEVCS